MKKSLLFVLVLLSTTIACFSQRELRLEKTAQAPASIARLAAYTTLRLDLPAWNAAVRAKSGPTLSFRLSGEGQKQTFSLYAHELRPAHSRSSVSRQKSRQQQAHWRGQTAAGATASFTIDPEFVLGQWRDGEDVWYLEPLWRLVPGADRAEHVLYRQADVIVDPNERCELIDPMPDYPAKGQQQGADAGAGKSREASKVAGGCFTVEIALAADDLLVTELGSAAATLTFMEGILTMVETDYDDAFDDQLDFVVVTDFIPALGVTDPWDRTTVTAVNGDNTVGLLPSFREWGRNGGFGATTYDVASLWSGRDFDGSTIGVAYMGGLCGNFGQYNILQNFTGTVSLLRALWSHELGHNFSAVHDVDADDEPIPGFIMTPFVSNTTTWSAQSIASINNFYPDAGCLSPCPEAVTPPTAVIVNPYTDVHVGSEVPFFDASTGVPTTYQWSFPGGQPATSSAPHPIVSFPATGTYQVGLTVTNAEGTSSTQVTLTVTDDGEDRQVVFYENFEGEMPDVTIDNDDAAGATTNNWFLSPVNGIVGDVSAGIDNASNNFPGARDRIQLPPLDFSELAEPTFELAYAYRRADQVFRDQLNVRVSTDGVNFVNLFTGDEDGSGNFATAPDNIPAFLPTSAADWCAAGPGCLNIDLEAYAGEPVVYLEVENVNGFGNFLWVDNFAVTARAAAALPVEWLAFTAAANGKVADLRWSVNQDEAHAGFYLERSADDGTSWEDLGWVAAKAGAENVSYDFLDYGVRPANTYLYRLRQQDLDGRESFSDIREVSFGEATVSTLFPNPAGERVRLYAPAAHQVYSLLDATGRTLSTGRLADGVADISLTGLPAGCYFVRVVDARGAGEVLRLVRR